MTVERRRHASTRRAPLAGRLTVEANAHPRPHGKPVDTDPPLRTSNDAVA
ncbi:hypothetical protein AB395_0000217 [Sinorhizobium fredii CCBAU 45436]|nr:hypothetical protein AB395_0000217 [Sinorhizobium fredii CCBAU 45436]